MKSVERENVGRTAAGGVTAGSSFRWYYILPYVLSMGLTPGIKITEVNK